MPLKDAIARAFDKKKRFEKKDKDGNWKYPMYWAIDLHDVIIPGTYTRNNEGKSFFPNAEEVLQWLTNRKDMCLILFTSSHEDSLDEIDEWFSKKGIFFEYLNGNPECKSNDLCSFEEKFYFDLMLEDKAGFDGETDWGVIKNTLIKLDEWRKKESHEQK